MSKEKRGSEQSLVIASSPSKKARTGGNNNNNNNNPFHPGALPVPPFVQVQAPVVDQFREKWGDDCPHKETSRRYEEGPRDNGCGFTDTCKQCGQTWSY